MLGSGAENLLSPSSYIEKHTLSGTEDVLRFAVGKNVILNVETQPDGVARVRDSARANSQILSEYKWERKEGGTTDGRVLAVRNKLIAYRLFNGTTGPAVRVMERESRNRQLVKDFRHPIVDIQWAVHVPLLAVLDANSNLYIYMVDEKGQKLAKYLNIIEEFDQIATSSGRLVWCPYIPDTEDLDCGREEVFLLGIVQDKRITLFQLHKIKEFIGRNEVSYSRVMELSGGLLSVQLDSQISVCKISPDATAMAVATTDGQLTFYVIEEESIQLASRIQPLSNNYIEELIFLDNLCVNSQEQFWKYVAISSDNGRRLAIFDCDTWECMAKMRFECPNQVGRMELLVEPSTRFLFLADYDVSNLFCIELSNTQQNGPLYFVSCTLVTFCNQFISIVPCMLSEPSSDSGGCLTLDDDEGVGGTAGHGHSAIATLVAITHRSLSEINLELDRFYTADPSIAISTIPQTFQMSRSHHQSQQNLEQHHSVEPKSEPIEVFSSLKETFPSSQFSSVKNHAKSSEATTQFIHTDDFSPGSKELTELMEKKFGLLTEKINDLSTQINQMHDENEQLRSNQNDNMSNVLEKISNELKLREERIEAAVRKLSKENADQVLHITEQHLTNCGLQMQRTLDLGQTRLAEQLHGSLERAVIPQVEVLCTQLFQQLNDTFRSGLQEFMDQLRGIGQQQAAMMAAVQAQSAVVVAAVGKEMNNSAVHQQQPPIDEHSLTRFIDGNQTRQAFDLVVNKGDQSLLNFVCNKIDPDDYFTVNASNTSVPLPIPLLLGLLCMLSERLDLETELRFRYIESALLSLNSKQSTLTQEAFQKMVQDEAHFRRALDRVNKALNAFVDTDGSVSLRRQTRIINQLIMNLLRMA